jgi:hypothetical protein
MTTPLTKPAPKHVFQKPAQLTDDFRQLSKAWVVHKIAQALISRYYPIISYQLSQMATSEQDAGHF